MAVDEDTQAVDTYICAMGILGSVSFMAMALPVMAYSMISAWVLIFLGEIFLCLNWAPTGAITLYVIKPEQVATNVSFTAATLLLFPLRNRRR